MTPLATSVVDECIVVPVGDEHCLGIVTRPTTPHGVGILLLPARDSSFGGRTRFVQRLTHRLASAGARVLRVDYLGTGQSDGGLLRMRANAPDTEEVVAAAHALRDLGHERIAVVGYCYGARAILDALDELPEVAAVALIAPPVRRSQHHTLTIGGALRKLTQPSRWADLLRRERRRRIIRKGHRAVRRSLGLPVATSQSKSAGAEAEARAQAEAEAPTPAGLAPAFVAGIVRVAERGIPTLLVYGSGDSELSTIAAANDPRVTSALDQDASSIELRVLPGSIHAHLSLDDATIEAVATWSKLLTIDADR